MLKKIFYILFCLIFANVVLAQSNTLHLQITDQNASFVPNVRVKLKQKNKVIKEFVKETPQTIIIPALEQGKYILEIEATGFQPKIQEIEIKLGKNELNIQLNLQEITETVTVEKSGQEKAVDMAFNNFLTRDQINALPDDPEEMKRVLKQIAGDQSAVILVDGFYSDKVPSKSQISSIRIVRSSFDAEYHKIGGTYINITTRVGNEQFSGSITFNFNNESINARNSFSLRKLPEQTKNGTFFLSGPIIKNKASFSFFALNNQIFEGKNINAILPNGNFYDSINSKNNYLLISPAINFNLTKNHSAKILYDFSDSVSKNMGVGGFNLSSRGYDITFRTHQLRFSESGYIGNRFLNEFRFQFLNEKSETISKSSATTVFVLDSFNSGGAGINSDLSKNSFMISDNLLFGFKNHALKIGFQTDIENTKEFSASNRNGAFIFSSLADFNLGIPAIYSQKNANTEVSFSQIQFGAFIQDDIRIKNNLNLSFGLRYEIQNSLNDKNNFSPRISFTYSPFKDGKTTFRGGVGIFYNWLESQHLSTIFANSNSQISETIILNPSFPNPFISGFGEILPKTFWQKDNNLKSPYIFHTSFAIEKQLPKKMMFRANYVYEKGIHQFRSKNINAPIAGNRPRPSFGNIINIESSAFFVRNSLNVNLSGSIKRNISFYFDYNLSNILSDADGIFSLPSDNYNLKLDRSVAKNDQRHRFSSLISWQIKKGLRFSANYFVKSPLPYNFTTGIDDNRDTNFNDRPIGIKRNSLRGTWNNQLDLSLSYAFSFINKKNANDSKSFSIVTTSSESISGFDFTDPKKRFSLKFYATAENVLNQNNFTNFVGVQTSPLFTRPNSSTSPRRLSFGLRFNF